MKYILLIFLLITCFFSGMAQDASPLEMAKATLKAHGGENFLKMQSMVLRGTGTVTAPGTIQQIPVKFTIVLSKEKYRFDLDGAAFFLFKQIFNGEQVFTSMDGINVPPIDLVGLPVLTKIEESGFSVSELPEKLKKKKKGFRITTPQGFYTDFVVDEKNSLVKEFSGKYQINGMEGNTSVEIQKYREVNGIMLPEKYLQLFESGQFSSNGNFTAKEMMINMPVDDGVFAKP